VAGRDVAGKDVDGPTRDHDGRLKGAGLFGKRPYSGHCWLSAASSDLRRHVGRLGYSLRCPEAAIRYGNREPETGDAIVVVYKAFPADVAKAAFSLLAGRP